MRRQTTHLSVAFALTVSLLSGCEEPTRPGSPDNAPAGAQDPSTQLSAEILGPTSIGASERCSWAARLTRVLPHYSIEWWRRDAGEGSYRLVETLPVYGGGLDGNRSFELRLEVRDATGSAGAEAAVYAGVDSGCVDGSEH